MSTKHLSAQFDKELNKISSAIMLLGGTTEEQLSYLIKVIHKKSNVLYQEKINQLKQQISKLEAKLDANLVTVIVRRQPTAVDLRLLVSISKVLMYLTNISTEIEKMSVNYAAIISESDKTLPLNTILSLLDHTAEALHNSLDVFARLDTAVAINMLCTEPEVSSSFRSFVREMITYILENPKTISGCINLVLIINAIERVSEQIKGINRQVIYISLGINVNNMPAEELLTLLPQAHETSTE